MGGGGKARGIEVIARNTRAVRRAAARGGVFDGIMGRRETMGGGVRMSSPHLAGAGAGWRAVA